MRIAVLAALLLSGSAVAQDRAPFTVAETGETFGSLQEAVNAIGSGAGTIRVAPGRYDDCAVQEAGRIVVAAETPGTVTFDGGVCEGKATLVLRGKSAGVEGLVFRATFVPDGNGAGIRLEQGNLDVKETLFADAQCGILSGSDPKGRITITNSTFSGLGKHPDGDGAHSLYIGRYGALKVSRTRFERGTGGHYLKSRAAIIDITDSSFDDSHGSNTNYHIDLPNGAVGRIAGNVFAQGKDKENYSAFITVAPEGVEHPSEGLVIENNRAWGVPGFNSPTTFAASWTDERVAVRDNQLGQGIKEFARR